jgi:transposase-like protein
MLTGGVREVLLGIRTVAEMVEAFRDEEECRRLLEAMVWPNGRACPACGYKRSIALAGRDMGRYRARPGLYQCSNGACHFQFTATTRTPLHATKLPLSTWLKALWLILQSDKGLSSIRLAEALGVSQPTAWRIGHALRLMLARENPLGGTIEIDEFFFLADGRRRSLTNRRRAVVARVCGAPQSVRFWRWCSGPARPRWVRPPAMPGLRWLPISRWMKSNACSRKRSSPQLTW